MLDPAPIDLEDFDAREGWILEIRIDKQGGAKVCPLLIHPLLFRILSSARSHGFLRSMEIMQESSSGGRGRIYHTLSGCG